MELDELEYILTHEDLSIEEVIELAENIDSLTIQKLIAYINQEEIA